MIYSKLLGQYCGRQRKQILKYAIYLVEKSKIPILTKIGCRIQKKVLN